MTKVCKPKTGWLSGDTYCANHGRQFSWPCQVLVLDTLIASLPMLDFSTITTGVIDASHIRADKIGGTIPASALHTSDLSEHQHITGGI